MSLKIRSLSLRSAALATTSAEPRKDSGRVAGGGVPGVSADAFDGVRPTSTISGEGATLARVKVARRKVSGGGVPGRPTAKLEGASVAGGGVPGSPLVQVSSSGPKVAGGGVPGLPDEKLEAVAARIAGGGVPGVPARSKD